jgi:Virulence-associated protein E/Bifunctional DNA primase/polymerase, N-terminal
MRAIETALALARAGVYVIPIWWPVADVGPHAVCDKTHHNHPQKPLQACACGNPECRAIAKHPVEGLAPNGLNDSTTDEKIIRSWFTWRSECNIAIDLARSGLCALDVDDPDGLEAAIAKLERAMEKYGELPETAEQISGSHEGGHLIFRRPQFPIRGVLDGLTIRGKNYVVVAPSLHKSGKRYEWRIPLTQAIAELPQGWLEALRKSDPIDDAGVPPVEDESDWLRRISDADRITRMREHLGKEKGERMGVDRQGMAFDVARTCARGFAVRDPRAVVSAMLEIFNPKCTPPYTPEGIADRVWKAYDNAHTPVWGESLEPQAECLKRKLPFVRGSVAEPRPPAPKAVRAGTAVVTHYECLIKSWAGSKKPEQAVKGKLLRAFWKGEALPCDDDQDLDDVEALAVDLLVKNAPPLADNLEIVAVLRRGLNQHVDELIAIVDGLRPGGAVPPEKEPENDEELTQHLRVSDKGITATPDNLEMLCRYDEGLVEHIHWDAVCRKLIGEGSFANEAGSLDTAVWAYIDRKWRVQFEESKIGRMLMRICRKYRSRDRLVEHLRSLTWDNTPRMDNWLLAYCQAELMDESGRDISSYVRDVGSKWLLGAVARAFEPGEKMDCVLVLEGVQGAKKSMTFDILGGDYYTASVIEMGSKDGMMLAGQKWICELAELASLVRSATEQQKAFLSARVDTYRPPYGRDLIDEPRRTVFCGTYNPEIDGSADYLTDMTGNRRWWPVRVGQVDDEALRRDRDQLWAEVVSRYYTGQHLPKTDKRPFALRWWFTADEQIEINRQTEQRQPEDPWVDIIMVWARMQIRGTGGLGNTIRACDRWTSKEIGHGALGLDPKDLHRYKKQLNSALRSAGFKREGRHWVHPELSVPDGSVPKVPEHVLH